MDLHSIFGVYRRQLLTPSYLDVKHLNDALKEWRAGIRERIIEIRVIKDMLGAERDLVRRYCLSQELRQAQERFDVSWKYYRILQRDSATFCAAYLDQFSRKREELGKRRHTAA